MSEEKLYAVKNHDGIYWDFSDITGFWSIYLDIADCPITTSKKQAEQVADEHGGHIVTFVEEPEKVVLTKEQAEIVERARDKTYPATYISNESDSEASDEEELLMKALANGYTVENEKKYNVKVPHTEDAWYYKSWNGNLRTICQADKKLRVTFTEAEIEHYGLQDCEKEEVR